MTEELLLLQDEILESLRESKQRTAIYLVNGVRLDGIIKSFDAEVILLESDKPTLLIYKQVVATIMPTTA